MSAARPVIAARNSASRRAEAGFTLFETMVALTIGALVLLAVLRAFSSAWLQVSTSAEITAASGLARQLLADARLAQGASLDRSGTTSGFDWQVRATRLTLPPLPAAAPSLPPNPASPARNNRTTQPPPATPPAPAQDWLLYRIGVDVGTTSGRHVRMEGLLARPADH